MALALYSSAPQARPFAEDKPVLLTSWWMTIFAAVIILFRLMGRFVRVERLFGEDRIAALVLIPLFVRMAFVHPILLWGTNNVLLDDALQLTETEIARRALGSRLVLVSRIIQPTILWLLKFVTLEFFSRLVGMSGRKRYTILLNSMRGILAATFIAVVISDLTECQPFKGYWQITPDPGPQCRQAYAHLLTATICNVVTDLLLVVFPVPIVVQSRIPLGRKMLLVMLFCLHLLTVVVAIYRVPEIIKTDGYQATRTLWASGEVFMATFAANALTIGTFVRDTGVKKQKFKYKPATVESANRTARREGGVKKTVGWDDPDDDFDIEEGGGTTVTARAASRADIRHSRGESDLKEPTVVAREAGQHASRRSESRDSLIPRSRFATMTPDPNSRVIKTTTIEVTVSDAAEGDMRGGHGRGVNGMLRHADSVATASRGRGSGVLLRELNPLPDAGAGQGVRRES